MIGRGVGVAAAALTLLATPAVSRAAPADEEGWESLAETPTPRQEVAYVASGGGLFLGGGLGTGLEFFTARHERFDPKSGAWTALAPLPEPAHHLQGVAVGGRIYYLGGLEGFPFAATGAVWEYDPASDSFASRAPMPPGRARGAAGVAARGGFIYVAGGQRSGAATAELDAYDPATDRWTTLPDLPAAREHLGAAFVGDRLYLIGGRTPAGAVTRTDAYDLSSGRWITGLAPLPTARGGLAVTVLGSEIFAIGGERAGSARAEVEIYDPSTDSWRAGPPMPTPRHGIQAPRLDGGLWVAAGATDEGYRPASTNEVLFAAGETRITALRVSPRRLEAGDVARITYRLTRDARVRFTLERRRRDGHFAPIRGAFGDRGRAGFNIVEFRARRGDDPLRTGGYRLVARPLSAGADRRRARFSIVP